MTDDMHDLAALWHATPGEDDRRDFARAAKQTPRLARASLWGELGIVVLLAGTILLAIFWNLGPATVLIGSLVLLVLGWSAWKRHHLGTIALLIEEGDRVRFLQSAVRAKTAELNRSAVGLAFVLPSALLTMLFGFTLRGDGGGGELGAFLLAVATTPRGLVALGFLLCALLVLIASHARLSRELTRLKALKEDYENEAELDRFLSS